MLNLQELEVFHEEANNCIDDSVASICKQQSMEYIYSFIESWKFTFNDKLHKIGEKIDIIDENTQEPVEKYCGIIMKDEVFENFDDMIEFVENELKLSHPCMLHVFCKLFPWDGFFGLEGVPNTFVHKALIVGIDKERDEILCTDGYYNKFNEPLSIDEYKKSAKLMITKFEVIDNFDNKDKEKEMFLEFQEYLRSNKDMFNRMKSFVDRFDNFEDIEKEILDEGEYFNFSPLNDNLRKVVRVRKKTKNLLLFFKNKNINEQLGVIINIFDDIIKSWETIILTLMKMSVDKKFSRLENVSDIIHLIIDKEKSAYDMLLKTDI